MPDTAIPYRRLREMAFQRFRPLWLLTDEGYCLLRFGGSFEHYGYERLVLGADCRLAMPFLYGTEDAHCLDLPFVETCRGSSAYVHIERIDGRRLVCLLDATDEYCWRQRTQQVANDVQLLNYRQQQILTQLQATREELEIRRRQAEEASRLQSRFIAGVSHEFRTPLTSVLGYTQRLRESATDFDSDLRAIERGARHLLTLVDNLLVQGCLESETLLMRRSPCCLGTVVDDLAAVFSPLAREKSLRLRVGGTDSLPAEVLVDEVRVRQILVNLLGNAIKFTAEGSVGLAVGWRYGSLSFCVYDTGPGIAPEMQARVFEPFDRAGDAGESGAGLGLAISRQLAERMGGTLTLTSRLGAGCRFDLTLPATALHPARTANMGDAVPLDLDLPRQAGRTVLLAEDDMDIRDLVRVCLERAGFELLIAQDGHEAVTLAESLHPDLVLTDLNLPGIDGCGVARRLRAAGYGRPVVALSASALASDRDRALHAGCNDYFTKPIDIDQLPELVAGYIGDGSSE